MNYYATFDQSGNIIGHYLDEIHDDIPKDGVKMTEEIWNLSKAGKIKRDLKYKKWLRIPEPTQIDILNDAKTQKKKQIEEWRDAAIATGVNYNGYVFDSDPVSIANLNDTLTVINCGTPIPPSFVWRTQDNQNVPMSEDNLKQLANVFFIHKNQCYVKSWDLKANVDLCKTINEINNITW